MGLIFEIKENVLCVVDPIHELKSDVTCFFLEGINQGFYITSLSTLDSFTNSVRINYFIKILEVKVKWSL